MRLHLLAVLVCTAALAATEPAAAEIIKLDRSALDGVYVSAETLDGVDYTLGRPDGPRSSFKRNQYLRIEYKAEITDIPYLTGVRKVELGEYAAAAEAFLKTGGKYLYLRELGLVAAAENFLKAGKFDEAVAAVATLEQQAPRSIHLPRATWLRGTAEVRKGDKTAAAQTFDQLIAKAGEWGTDAAALGARGKAELLRGDKKFAEAAAALQSALAKLSSAEEPEDFGQVGIDLAGDLTAAGDQAKALATYQRVAYANVPATIQSRAHLGWGKLLEAKGETVNAFDRYCIAAVLRGGDPRAQGEAAKLAKALATKLASDASLSPDDQRDYRNYGPKL